MLDVSLLHGLRADTRKHFREAGITSLQQIVALEPDELKRFKGIKSTAPGVHAHARAFVEQKPIWYGNLPTHCLQSGIMFDLETDPNTQVPWSLGWSDGQGDTRILLVVPDRTPYTFLLANAITVITVPDTDTAWQEFADAVGDTAIIYHWSGYDAGVLRQTAPLDVRHRLESRMHDLLRTFNGTVKLPIKSSSLKVVAPYLGFSWGHYQDWWQAYQDYRRWLQCDDLSIIEAACTYQRDDVVALGLIWQWMVENHSG